MSAAQLEARVLAWCGQQALFASDEPGRPLQVAAAVSGGADSMALLRILQALAPQLGIELSACHVNHGLRGAAADADEAFVRAECARLGVPLRVFRAQELGETPPRAGEAWARELRYRCFAKLCEAGIDRVATAHTVTDQAETLLFRLARGAGLHGAAGIRPRRGAYVRPLLCLARADTERYCAAVGQRWVTDETNLEDAYARNRLRHHALPALCAANAAAEQNLARFCEKAARADEYFARRAQALLEEAARAAQARKQPAAVRRASAVYALDPLQAADDLILERAAHLLVAPVRDAEELYIRLLCALVREGSGAVQLRAGVRLCAGDGFLWREDAQPGEAEPVPPTAFDPAACAEYPLPGGRVLASRLRDPSFYEKTQVVHKKDLKNQADYARITMSHSALVLRSRLPGDRFRPAGRGVSKSLRKLFNEAAVPPQERARLPLLADGSEVVWLYGFGFADGLAPDEASRRILELTVQDKREDVES